MHAISPAKIHLSGEHAVVYGKPAIAMTVDRYVTTHLTSQTHLSVTLNNDKSMALDQLPELRQRLLQKFQQYQQGIVAINDVLADPYALIFFVVAHYAAYCQLELPYGLAFTIESDIPIGCGMGSSAAIILSVLSVLERQFQQGLSTQQIFEIALVAEKLQHGHTNGFDLQVCQRGGIVGFQQVLEITQPFYLIHTGRPEATTGECVAQVAERFTDSDIWDEFAGVTQQVGVALQNGGFAELAQAIQLNHRLLCEIGVVPTIVQQFVDRLQQAGAAAKICGGGSIRGDRAGIVLVLTEDKKLLKTVSDEYAYQFLPVKMTADGVKAYD